MGFYAGIDLGGTNIAVGIVNDEFEIVAKASVKTNAPRPEGEIADDMARATKMACEKAGIKVSDLNWVGVGTPGAADRYSGIVLRADNLGFNHTPLRNLLSERLEGKPVYIENDANAATYGEVVAGAAKGVKDVIMITLGTGVGGGIIVDGDIYTGNNCFGAELGHMVIEYNGVRCTCGRKGCFESYCSATALIRMTKEEMLNSKDSKMWELAGGSIDNVGGRTSFDAMRLGDEAGKRVVDKYISYLAAGITNLINIFQPAVFIIGGGVCNEKNYLLDPLNEIVFKEEYSQVKEGRCKIVTAELGNDAGIIGAAFLGKATK